MTDFTSNMVNGATPLSISYDNDYFLVKLNTTINIPNGVWQFCYPDGSFYTSGNIYPFAYAEAGPNTNQIFFGASTSYTAVNFSTDFKIQLDQSQTQQLYDGSVVQQTAVAPGYTNTTGINFVPNFSNKIISISPGTAIQTSIGYFDFFQKGISALVNYDFSGLTPGPSLGSYVYIRVDYASDGSCDLYGWKIVNSGNNGWFKINTSLLATNATQLIGDNSSSQLSRAYTIAGSLFSGYVYGTDLTDIGLNGGIGTVGSTYSDTFATIPPKTNTSIIVKLVFSGTNDSMAWNINSRQIMSYDVSPYFSNQTYLVAPNYYFFAWLNKISGANELLFATSSTSSNPNNWRLLVNFLGWSRTSNTLNTIVSGAATTSTETFDNTSLSVLGDGQGGFTTGYHNSTTGSYNVTSNGANIVVSFRQEKNVGEIQGTTVFNGNISPLGTTWDSALSQTGLYKITLLSGGGFDITSVTPVCYRGDSLITVLNKATNEPELKHVKKITKDDFVFSVTQNKFVPVLLNIITYKNKNYRLLKKNCLGENKPSEDLYITGGHPLLYNGKETPVSLIPEAEDFSCAEEEVYCISTSKREYILVNNIECLTWSYFAWKNLCVSGKIKYAWNLNEEKPYGFSEIKVELIGDENLEPKNIMICKNGFGLDNPKFDMVVNENYKLLVDNNEVLIKDMINGNSINFIH